MLQYTILDRIKKPFVIYKDTFTNQVCLDPRQGTCKKKSMVISLPFSGSHMVQQLFSNLGLQHVRVQHDRNTLGDYRFLTDTDRINFSRSNDSYNLPFIETCKWITDGQFVHNHMRFDDMSYMTIRDSDIIPFLLKRDLRNCIVSHARQKQRDNVYFMNEHARLLDMYISTPYYNEIIETIKAQMPWFENKTFDVISFETLSGQYGKDAQYQSILKLFEDFEISGISMDDIVQKSIGIKTFSYSGENSEWQKYWNDSVEKWYNETGLKAYNIILGYDSATPVTISNAT